MLFDQNKSLSSHFLKKKNQLQVELLIRFAPFVRLEEDLQQQEDRKEKLFSIQLSRGAHGYLDACHIPEHVLPERVLIAYHIQPA